MPVIRTEFRPLTSTIRGRTRACFAAQGRTRQSQQHRVTNDRLEVDEAVDDPADLVRIRSLVGRRVRVGEQLGQLDLKLIDQQIQAPSTLARDRRRCGARYQHTLHDRLQPHVQGYLFSCGYPDHVHPDRG